MKTDHFIFHTYNNVLLLKESHSFTCCCYLAMLEEDDNSKVIRVEYKRNTNKRLKDGKVEAYVNECSQKNYWNSEKIKYVYKNVVRKEKCRKCFRSS